MNPIHHLASAVVLGLCSTCIVLAQPTQATLIVVEDRGGTSAMPYYHALNPQDVDGEQPAAPVPPIRIPGSAQVEAAMLPVQSQRLSPGSERRRVIRAPGLMPFFLIGDDAQSQTWLRQRHSMLSDLQAVGLVVQVSTPQALAALRRVAPDLQLSPVYGDDIAARLGLRHYPVLVTPTGIEP